MLLAETNTWCGLIFLKQGLVFRGNTRSDRKSKYSLTPTTSISRMLNYFYQTELWSKGLWICLNKHPYFLSRFLMGSKSMQNALPKYPLPSLCCLCFLVDFLDSLVLYVLYLWLLFSFWRLIGIFLIWTLTDSLCSCPKTKGKKNPAFSSIFICLRNINGGRRRIWPVFGRLRNLAWIDLKIVKFLSHGSDVILVFTKVSQNCVELFPGDDLRPIYCAIL